MITAAARRFLMDRLSPIVRTAGWTSTSTAGVVTPRLFHGVAPTGTTFPFVVFQQLSPGNEYLTNVGNRIWATPLWMVKVVTQGTSTDAIEATVDTIDGALHQARGSVSGAIVLDCIREELRDQPDLIDGKSYISIIGAYRMKIQEA